jgi:hypothetical protein
MNEGRRGQSVSVGAVRFRCHAMEVWRQPVRDPPVATGGINTVNLHTATPVDGQKGCSGPGNRPA